MLNRHFIEKWANALPDFQQGQNFLQPEEGKFCCLGVACELYRQETGEGAWEKIVVGAFDERDENGDSIPSGAFTTEVFSFVLDDGEGEYSLLPQKVLNFLGLTGAEGAVAPYSFDYYMYEFQELGKNLTTLSGANDAGATFVDIKNALLKMLEDTEGVETNA